MLEDGNFTSQDLRNRLYSSLRQTGAVDSLKSQLRNRLVQELKRLGVNGSQETAAANDKPSSVFLTAANSLVADHLRKCQYDYSFSVFLPECGLSERKLFSNTDLLQLLKISKNSHLYKNIASNDGSSQGFLWQFLSEVAGLHGSPSYDTGVQTDQIGLPPIHSIEEKLKSVDEYYTNYDQSSQLASIEERMLMYRKAVDQQAQGEIRMQVARLKETELSRMRSDEKEKFWDKLNASKSEIERDYRVKYNALIERERNSMEQLQRQQRETERESYMQRQNLLSEIEAIRQREVELKRQQETFERERKMSEELARKKEESIRRREEFMRRAETEYDQKLQAEMSRYKAEAQTSYMERYRDLEFREIKAKEDTKRLGDDLQNIENIKDELRAKRLSVQRLEAEVSSYKKDLQAAQQEIDILSIKAKEAGEFDSMKEENVRLKRELNEVRTQVTQMSRSLDLERRRHEDLLQEIGEQQNHRPHPEVLFLQREMERLRSQLRQEKAMTEQLRTQVGSRSFEERGRARELMTSFEEQTYQQEEMVQEIDLLRQQLSHTRQALKDQVYGRPSSPKSPDAHYMTENITGSDDATLLSQTDDYSYSGLLSDSKNRLKRLEQEAENLEENYRNFQHRMTTVEATLPQVSDFIPTKKFTSSAALLPSTTPGTPVRVNVDRPQRMDVPQTYSSFVPFHSSIIDRPPPSYASRMASAVEVDQVPKEFPPDSSELLPASTSASSDVNEYNKVSGTENGPAPKESLTSKEDRRSQEEESEKEREESEKEREESESPRREPDSEPLDLPPREPVSLDRAWTGQKTSSVDSNNDRAGRRSDSPQGVSISKESEAPKEEPKKQEPGIDPMMQKYMEMIKQKREMAATAQKEIVDSDRDISENLDKSKSQDEASDGIFDEW